jgi:hypothetical protein
MQKAIWAVDRSKERPCRVKKQRRAVLSVQDLDKDTRSEDLAFCNVQTLGWC